MGDQEEGHLMPKDDVDHLLAQPSRHTRPIEQLTGASCAARRVARVANASLFYAARGRLFDVVQKTGCEGEPTLRCWQWITPYYQRAGALRAFEIAKLPTAGYCKMAPLVNKPSKLCCWLAIPLAAI